MSIFHVREARIVYGPAIAEIGPPCSTPEQAAKLLRSIIPAGEAREMFAMIGLDSRNRPILTSLVSVGTLNSSLVHPREVFRPAILAPCAAIIIGHNHPSGDLSPSSEDDSLTDRLKEAGKILGIPVLDHVVITDDRMWSYRSHGKM